MSKGSECQCNLRQDDAIAGCGPRDLASRDDPSKGQSPTAGTPTPMRATSIITLADCRDHFLARWGVNRMGHKVGPGLYVLGSPTPASPVFVTANYALSFDALRSALAGMDAYLLVLDTHGINVWCAAGKETFGTEEMVRRVEATRLREVVSHRVLILPQLGAPGVAAHDVKKRTGFRVEYGPVRAGDLPQYLRLRQAGKEMRRVRFSLSDRLVLIPVELVHVLPRMSPLVVLLFFIGATLASAGALSVILAGTVLFPTLPPWLPTPNFSTKGFVLGGLVALPFALASLLCQAGAISWPQVGSALVCLLLIPPGVAYLGLNLTGSTAFTSRSGVRREILTYVPVMARMGASASCLCSLRCDGLEERDVQRLPGEHASVRCLAVHRLRPLQSGLPSQGVRPEWSGGLPCSP